MEERDVSEQIEVATNDSYSELEHIKVQFDLAPFSNLDCIKLQVGKKVGGVIRLKSKEVDINLVDTDIKKPVIESFNYEEVVCPSNDLLLKVYAEGLNEKSKLEINNQEFEATQVLDNFEACQIVLEAKFLEECGEELDVQIRQYTSNGYKTNILSDVAILPVKHINLQDIKHEYEWINDKTQIMHALGDYEGKTYTNSREALFTSIEGGAKVFEFDLSFDSEGKLIGRHDWSQSLLKSDSVNLEDEEINGLPLSYAELKNSLKDQYTVLSFEEIVEILEENSDYYIVTDTKYNDPIAVSNMFNEIINVCKAHGDAVIDQIIVQVYSEEMYKAVLKEYQFKSVIYTLYMCEDTEEEVLEFLNSTNIRAVTFPADSRWDNDAFIQSLLDLGCHVLVHTINDYELEKEYLSRGLSGVYTDVLTPNKLSEFEKKENIVLSTANGVVSEMNIHDYFTKLANSDFTILISARDDASNVEGLEEDLFGLGLKVKVNGAFRKGYIAVIDAGKLVYEEIGDEVLKYSWTTENGQLIEMESAGNDAGSNASILINGVECSVNQRGLNIVVLDKLNNTVVDSVIVDNYDPNAMVFAHIDADSIQLPSNPSGFTSNKKKIIRYFNDLQNPNFVIMMTIQDEATMLVDDDIMNAMSDIGISSNYRNAFRNSYVAVFDGGQQIIQQFGEEEVIEYSYELDGNRFVITSGGNGSGVQASILWNDREMAAVERGLHILVYDKLLGTVISYCRMELFEELACEITEVNKEIYE